MKIMIWLHAKGDMFHSFIHQTLDVTQHYIMCVFVVGFDVQADRQQAASGCEIQSTKHVK